MLLTTAAVFAAVMMLNVPAAWSDTFESATSGIWDESSSWTRTSGSSHTYPQAGDTATVLDGDTITLDSDEACANLSISQDAEVDTVTHTLTISGVLTIDPVSDGSSDGLLNVSSTGGVTLAGTSATQHYVDGDIILAVSGSDLTITTNNATFSYQSSPGTVFGCHDSAVISVASGKTLFNAVTIQGHLEISGDGNFTNQYVVESTSDPNSNVGTLKLAVGGTLDDSSAAYWKASAANAILNFHSDIGTLNSLEGQFQISGSSSAEIEVNEALTTTGLLYMTNGLLDANQDVHMGNASNHLYMTGGTIDVYSVFTHE
jgi:hypothetical protein